MYPKLVEDVIEQFVKLPGIGRRSAERMAFWFLDRGREDAESFARAVTRLKEQIRFCPNCNNLTDQPECRVCSDPRRDQTCICVVENPKDVMAIERTGAYRGLYHVLLGALNPADGRGPDELKLDQLIGRIRDKDITEVVIATDPDTEGEMTSLHIIEELRPLGVKMSRIGVGLPMGSSVEYVDHSTLTMSMNSRREI
ncbi:MAG: recombination mediator RecR [Candidatus Omnitrophota bacterium]